MTRMKRYSPAQLANEMKRNGKILYNVAYYLHVNDISYTVFLMIPFRGMSRYVFHAIDSSLEDDPYDFDESTFYDKDLSERLKIIAHKYDPPHFRYETIYLKSSRLCDVDLQQFVEDCFTELAKQLNVDRFEVEPEMFFDDERKRSFNESRYR